MSDPKQDHDAAEQAESAREEVQVTAPTEAPLPDTEGLAHTMSPVDLPEPEAPLAHPLRWTVTVIAVAGLFLALFNAGSIRSWSYELKEGDVTQRIVSASESWFDLVDHVGLEAPVNTMRGAWKQVQNARFPGQEPAPETETGPDAEAPEPAE